VEGDDAGLIWSTTPAFVWGDRKAMKPVGKRSKFSAENVGPSFETWACSSTHMIATFYRKIS
jgi:hypothetical protein